MMHKAHGCVHSGKVVQSSNCYSGLDLVEQANINAHNYAQLTSSFAQLRMGVKGHFSSLLSILYECQILYLKFYTLP